MSVEAKLRLVAAAGAMMGSAARAQSPPQRGDAPAGAARYFQEIRAYPATQIPAGARQAAMAQMRARWPRAFTHRNALLSSAPNLPSTTTWTPLGPAPLTFGGGTGTSSGRLNSIAIDPKDPQRIF